MQIKNQMDEAGRFAAQRRLFLRAAGFLPATAALGLGTLPSMAWAGGQVEEPLSDSVRTALSLAVAASSTPPVPIFLDEKSQQAYQNWLAEMSARLGKRRSFMGQQEREELLTHIRDKQIKDVVFITGDIHGKLLAALAD